MLGGYHGKILRVDMTNETLEEFFFDEKTLKQFIGGSGLGAKILYDETDSTTDPLGPENRLIFMSGPMVGTKAPNNGRYEVVTRSPLTGSYGEASSGGTWGSSLKKSGYDGIVVQGKGSHPMYLNIDSGKAELIDAATLWGKDTFECDKILKEKFGKRTSVCCIGPSGEKLSRIACIMNDGDDARTAGRCGVGAVMGSKMLKAISVNGNIKVNVNDEETFNASVKDWVKKIYTISGGLREFGTAGALELIEEVGDLPVNNWRDGNFDVSKLTMKHINETVLSGRYSCSNCSMKCGRVVTIPDGPYKAENIAGPEYETLALFGPNCLVDDIAIITRANEICNRYGLDTIGAANAVSYVMEAFERGIITKEMLGGIEAHFGNGEELLAVLEKIAKREDIGDLLAEGTAYAAKELGGVAEEFTVTQRGMDFPAHDPRYADSIGLEYAVSPRGACHLATESHGQEYGHKFPGFGFADPIDLENHSIKNKPQMNVILEHIMCLFDSMTYCKFVLDMIGDDAAQVFTLWLNSVTGWDYTPDELLKTGERIFNLKRMYLVRDGQSRKDDKLPQRMRKRRMTGGSANNIADIDGMLDEYYELRKWNEFGIPTEETLTKLGLEFTIKDRPST